MIAQQHPPTARAGTTLTEVLMALLVMGIGLVSVATLFPLSLLRSVEATQLTNATLLRMNAEAKLRALQSVNPTTGAVIERGIVEDPDADGDVREHDTTKFVFDPLGAATFLSDSSPLAGSFGWIDTNNNRQFDGSGEIVAGGAVSRFAFGMETSATFLADARNFVTLPDSFITLSDQLAGTFSYNAAGPAVVASGGPNLGEYVGQKVRVTALHADVRASGVRFGDVQPDGVTIALESALPANFTNATIGRLLVDLPEQRYTWFATVRRFGVRPSVTVVCCFRRNFAPEDERVYQLGEPAGSYNEFEINLELATAAGSNVNLDSLGNPGGLPPGLKRGGWMFDLYTFRWWKISSVQEFTRSGVKWARITTDPEEVDPSPRPRGVGTPAGPVYAVFPQNVVEAYTLKKE